MTRFRHYLPVVLLFTLSGLCFSVIPDCHAQQAQVVLAADTSGTDLDAPQAQAFIQAHPDVVILDVRTPEEYAAGHINKSKNINTYDPKFVKQLAALDRSKTYVVHCAMGPRSRKAVAILNDLGFKHIYHLNGGFTGWKQAGQPIVNH